VAGEIGTGWHEAFMGGSREAERALLDRVLPKVERIQDTVAGRQSADVRRAFHNKGRPLAVEFTVADDVPGPFRLTYLQPGSTYPGFGRFSRSQSFHQKDGDLDQRGFAFRIETEAGPQDILLSNTPVSFARDPVEFMTAASIFVESPKLLAAARVIRALGLREGLRVLGNLMRPPDRAVAFTGQPYWSRTPFAFGSTGAAARLVARPIGALRRVATGDDPDALSTDLIATLVAGPRAFELYALPFVDDARTPIEDTSRDWPESVTTPVLLGRVTLLQQDLVGTEARALAARVEAVEAFSPWTTPGLRPLGRSNRARRLAYDRSASHRGATRPDQAATAAPPSPSAAQEAASIGTMGPVDVDGWRPGPGLLDRATAWLLGQNLRAIWGYGGAAAAALFAFWLLFQTFPMDLFAWDVRPRFAQAFIGAGYVFRTAFFVNAAREKDWLRLRWIVWGNLVFTGVLLLATFWHAEEFHWKPSQTLFGHIWVVLYIVEPVAMIYLVPRGIFRAPGPTSGGPIHPLLKGFLILVAAMLLTNGLLLVLNPTFADTRWPWALNPLDARIVAAWFLGWSVWSGTLALARDWDEIRTAVRLFILNAVALLVVIAVFRDQFVPNRPTPYGFAIVLGMMTAVMVGFHMLQERRRPAPG